MAKAQTNKPGHITEWFSISFLIIVGPDETHKCDGCQVEYNKEKLL